MTATCDASQLEKGLQKSPSSSWPSDEGTATSQDNDPPPKKGLKILHNLKSKIFGLIPKLSPWNHAKGPQLYVHGRLKPTFVRKVEDYPKGFPQLSNFLDSDDAFMVYRRFGSVFSRLLLTKQDEIRRMESTLLAMDRTDQRNGDFEYLKTTVEDERRDTLPTGWPQGRRELLVNLEKKTMEYADLLLKARELKAIDKPSSRDYRSVLHFMEADGGQLYEAEMDFIYDKEDLVTLRPGRDHGWLDVLVERFLLYFRCRPLMFLFCSEESRSKSSTEELHYYDRNLISGFVTLLITLGVLALLVVPIWLLYKLSIAGTITTSPETIGVILIFTLAFFVGVKAVTTAKRHEIVAASAA
ncbi:MAG: hypothetical protein Q9218_005332 [Villophora microphyllina]